MNNAYAMSYKYVNLIVLDVEVDDRGSQQVVQTGLLHSIDDIDSQSNETEKDWERTKEEHRIDHYAIENV